MKLAISILFGILWSGLHADESIEPNLNYTLHIGDRSYEITEGKPFVINQSHQNAEARLVANDHRVFAYQNFSFKYPRYFAFEADLSDPENRNWTLSGNDCKIMIFSIRGALTPKDFAASLAQSLGNKNTTISTTKIRLGKKTYDCAFVDAKIVDNRIVMEVLQTTSAKGETKLFVIQDSVSDKGAHSQDYQKLMKILRDSFVEPKTGEQYGGGQPATRPESK